MDININIIDFTKEVNLGFDEKLIRDNCEADNFTCDCCDCDCGHSSNCY